MAVRPPDSSGSNSTVKRKLFIGDLASHWTPEADPTPTTARGRRRATKGKQTRKPPAMLIKGLAHRAHTHPSKLSTSSRDFVENHHKLVPLTRAYKRNK